MNKEGIVMKEIQTKKIVLSGLGICLVFASTLLLKIPNGFQGYFNCGDGVILAFASLVNPAFAFCIGGIGSALADIAGGYASYAIFTLVIKGLEAVLASVLIKQDKNLWFTYTISSLLMVTGYFVADSFVSQSMYIALLSIPTNILQGVVGVLIGRLLYPILRSTYKED